MYPTHTLTNQGKQKRFGTFYACFGFQEPKRNCVVRCCQPTLPYLDKISCQAQTQPQVCPPTLECSSVLCNVKETEHQNDATLTFNGVASKSLAFETFRYKRGIFSHVSVTSLCSHAVSFTVPHSACWPHVGVCPTVI